MHPKGKLLIPPCSEWLTIIDPDVDQEPGVGVAVKKNDGTAVDGQNLYGVEIAGLEVGGDASYSQAYRLTLIYYDTLIQQGTTASSLVRF